jgi:hypothetical protein
LFVLFFVGSSASSTNSASPTTPLATLTTAIVMLLLERPFRSRCTCFSSQTLCYYLFHIEICCM